MYGLILKHIWLLRIVLAIAVAFMEVFKEFDFLKSNHWNTVGLHKGLVLKEISQKYKPIFFLIFQLLKVQISLFYCNQMHIPTVSNPSVLLHKLRKMKTNRRWACTQWLLSMNSQLSFSICQECCNNLVTPDGTIRQHWLNYRHYMISLLSIQIDSGHRLKVRHHVSVTFIEHFFAPTMYSESRSFILFMCHVMYHIFKKNCID